MLGLDIRFVVTSLDVGSAEWIYDSLYCARGQAENLIKLHKTQLARHVPKPTSSAACPARCSRSVRNRLGLRPLTRPIPPTRTKQVDVEPGEKAGR
jgi:hypothetical protein